MEKAIWLQSTPEQKVILVTLLTMANHKEKQWIWQGEKFEAKPGQFVTSLDSIVKQCGIGVSNRNVRTAIDKFENLEFLTNESTKTGRLITIVNWRVYQETNDDTDKASDKEVTKHRQSTDKDLTANKNDKNVKNDKKNIYAPEFELFWTEYPELGHQNSKPQTFKNFTTLIKKNVSAESLIQAASNYSTDCKTEEKTEYLYKASNFVGKAEYYKSYLPNVWIPIKPKPSSNKQEQQRPSDALPIL